MNKFEAIKAFVSVAEEGSFAAGARRLGLSRSAVNRQVFALEDDLGAQLLNRSTRRVTLTDSGLIYLDRARTVLADLSEADRAVSRNQEEPNGLLRINGPMSFGIHHLSPAITAFMAQYPALRVECTLNDRLVDPYEEGFDLTIRISDLPDSELVARKLASVRRITCASPDYLERHVWPLAPRDLRGHRCLHYGNNPTGQHWTYAMENGLQRVTIDPVMTSNSGETLRCAALAGLGVAILPDFTVGEDLNANRLIALLDDFAPPPIAAYAIYPPNRFLAAKVRACIEFLAGWFKDHPPDAACRERNETAEAS